MSRASDHRVTRREIIAGGAAAAAGLAVGFKALGGEPATRPAILNFNQQMEYRRCGKTNLMISAVSMGGHWKRVDVMKQEFARNRADVVSRCIDLGVNYIDACTHDEVMAYSEALRGRRDKMYLGVSFYEQEVRNPEYRKAEKLLSSLDTMLQKARIEHADIWRITCLEPGGQHDFDTSCEVVEALEKAQKQGKARFTGISSHDRRWLKMMIEYFPQVQVVLTPYTARTKAKPTDSLFDAIKKCDVGCFGIKPFASNSLFRGDSSPGSQHKQRDDDAARLAIRHILANDAITAPIPGLISMEQADNMAKAIQERRQLDATEAARLNRAMDEAWERLPEDYQWLKQWEYA